MPICWQSQVQSRKSRYISHFYAKSAAENSTTVVCNADVTYVFIICLGLSLFVDSKIRRVTKTRVRLVHLVTNLAGAKGKDACMVLVRRLACTVSAFAEQGMLKALKILRRCHQFREAFSSLGTSSNFSEDEFM